MHKLIKTSPTRRRSLPSVLLGAGASGSDRVCGHALEWPDSCLLQQSDRYGSNRVELPIRRDALSWNVPGAGSGHSGGCVGSAGAAGVRGAAGAGAPPVQRAPAGQLGLRARRARLGMTGSDRDSGSDARDLLRDILV